MSVARDATITTVKNNWFYLTGQHPDFQHLTYDGKCLDDGARLSDYNIKDHSTIQQIINQRPTATRNFMQDLELDHYSDLLETVFASLDQGNLPQGEVLPSNTLY